jgi:hypothetical protein
MKDVTLIFFGVCGLFVLLGAFVFGKFNVGFDDFTEGWPVTRRDKPRWYWLAIATLIAILIFIGVIVAMNHGIDILPSAFKL